MKKNIYLSRKVVSIVLEVQISSEEKKNPETEQFYRQMELFTHICEHFATYLSIKNFDFSTDVSESNSPLFHLAQNDRERLLNDLARFKNEIEAQFQQQSFDTDHKRLIVLTAFDTLKYFAEQIAVLFTLSHQFAPANNRGISPHRSLSQTGAIDIDDLLDITLARDSQVAGASAPASITTANTTYGRFTFGLHFVDLYRNLREMLDARGGETPIQVGVVNSGMSADVCAQLLIQNYVKKMGGANERIAVFNEPNRYYEHKWAKSFAGDGAFSLRSRPNTTETDFDCVTQWDSLISELEKESFVVLQTDVVPNQKDFGTSPLLDNSFLGKLNDLPTEKKQKLIIVIDTTLYPTVQLSKLFGLLPKEAFVIATSSLNKFHQLGFDIGGSGAIAIRSVGAPLDLRNFLIFSGLTPSPRELGLLQLLLEPKLLSERMKIIHANTQIMIEIFRNRGITVNSIAIDDRLANPEEIGGLISLPKLGESTTSRVLEDLIARNIQLDIRTSFGHNTTSLEDVHMQNWSRISVGIEDAETIKIIANTIADHLSQNMTAN